MEFDPGTIYNGGYNPEPLVFGVWVFLMALVAFVITLLAKEAKHLRTETEILENLNKRLRGDDSDGEHENRN